MKVLRLAEVKLTRKEEETLLDTMSNLPKLNDALKDDDLVDIETLRKMIALERRTKQRPATIGRLVGRFKTLLSREIDHELAAG
jgi:Asp-tRNA(Asn)/Glu-tRNA(Gln) amidotransferase C subunit